MEHESFFNGGDRTTSALAALVDDTLRERPPTEGFSARQVPAYLAVIVEHGMQAAAVSDDVLAAVRADANSDSWVRLRTFMQPLMGWLYSEDGPATLAHLAAKANVSVPMALACLASHWWIDDTSCAPLPAERIPGVVATGLGLSLGLLRQDAAFAAYTRTPTDAAEWPSMNSDSTSEKEELDRVRAVLVAMVLERLIAEGITAPSHAGEAAESNGYLYRATCATIPEQERLRMVKVLEQLAGQRQIHAHPLYILVSHDPSDLVVSSAALALAQLLVTTEDPVLGGVRFLAGSARQYAKEGDDVRAAAVLTGLLLLGDRRVVELVGPCWRWLDQDGRRALARLPSNWVYAAVVEWLLDWLEDCEGDEFGAVAGTLARLGIVAESKGVIDVQRTIPTWAADDGRVAQVTAQWSAEEYADQLRRRLLQLAARETRPRIMPEVIRRWSPQAVHEERVDVDVTYQGVSLHILVTPIGENMYRLEESILLADEELECGDIISGTIEAGRLTISARIRKTPLVRYEFLLSKAIVGSKDLDVLKDQIIEYGGMWEQIAGGMFVVHLPKDCMLDVENELGRIKP